MKIRPVGDELFLADGRTDRQTRDIADRRPEHDHLVVETCSRTSIEHNKLVFFMVIGNFSYYITHCALADRSRA
jgi:hypothetical protein